MLEKTMTEEENRHHPCSQSLCLKHKTGTSEIPDKTFTDATSSSVCFELFTYL